MTVQGLVARLHAAPLHVRLSWTLPVLFVLLSVWAANHNPEDQRILAHTALIDATLSTALFLWFCTPRAERNIGRSLTLALRGVFIAALAFPELRQYLWLEGLGLGLTAWYVRRGLRQPLPEHYADLDDLERQYAFFSRLSPRPALARLLVSDRVLLSHLFLRPRLPAGRHFGTRRGATTGVTFTLLILMTFPEGLLIHVLLERWSPTWAWGVTGLTALSVLWLLAYGRALAVRPVTVGPRRLYLRSGVHWTGSTSLLNVVAARAYDRDQDGDALSIAIDNQPNVTLLFAEPVHLHGLYWVEKRAQKVALHVDDTQGFLALLPRIHGQTEQEQGLSPDRPSISTVEGKA